MSKIHFLQESNLPCLFLFFFIFFKVVSASAKSFDLSSPELSKRHWSVKAFKGAVRQIPVSHSQQFFFSIREFETAKQIEEMSHCWRSPHKFEKC